MAMEPWLYLGDCLEVMKTMPDNRVDMVLADLPYGTTQCAWDVIIPFEPLWRVAGLFESEPVGLGD